MAILFATALQISCKFRARLQAAAVALGVLLAAPLPSAVCAAQGPAQSVERHDNPATTSGGLSWGGEADFNYRYVWHGIAFTRGPVMQPSIFVSKYDLTLTVWSNLVLNNEPQRGTVNETDIILEYSKTRGKWVIEPSFFAYLNRPPLGQSDPVTSEISGKVSREAGPVKIYTSHTFDIQAYRGSWFGDAGVAYEGQWKKANIVSSASAGGASSKFNEVYIGPAKRAFNFLGGDFSLKYPLGSHLSVRPHFEFSRIMDERLRRALRTPTVWNVGLALGMDF